MAHYGNMPYQKRLEHMTQQSFYHDINLCGSSFHGLATTIEQLVKNDELGRAIQQIDRCILSRQYELNKRTYPDPIHNEAVNILRKLKSKIEMLNENYYYYGSALESAIIRYSDNEMKFTVNVGGKFLGGNRRIKTRRTKTRRTKTRRTKTRRTKS